jgi:hypothetical protein
MRKFAVCEGGIADVVWQACNVHLACLTQCTKGVVWARGRGRAAAVFPARGRGEGVIFTPPLPPSPSHSHSRAQMRLLIAAAAGATAALALHPWKRHSEPRRPTTPEQWEAARAALAATPRRADPSPIDLRAAAQRNHAAGRYRNATPADVDVAAFVYDPWNPDPTLGVLHGANWTEWELVKAATPRFPGHIWPKVPVWGYENTATAAAYEQRIAAATAHGIGVFLFDWYWAETQGECAAGEAHGEGVKHGAPSQASS